MNKVSIITPTYNSAKFVSKTIDSVLAQKYQDWEMIISDDCSTDNTWEIISEYANKDSRIKVFRLDINSGAGVARNNSINEATGRFIAFLDSDDTWHIDKLTKQVKFMLENQVELSYTSYKIVTEHGAAGKLIIPPKQVNYNKMLKNDYIGCLTAMYDTNRLGKVFMPVIRKRQDWALWLKILEDLDWAVGIQEELAYYTVRTGSISSNKIKLIKYNWGIYRWLGHSKLVSTIYMIRFLFYYSIYKMFGWH